MELRDNAGNILYKVSQSGNLETLGGSAYNPGGGGPHSHAQVDITNLTTDLAAKQASSEKGQANGYASLGADGKVPSAQLVELPYQSSIM